MFALFRLVIKWRLYGHGMSPGRALNPLSSPIIQLYMNEEAKQKSCFNGWVFWGDARCALQVSELFISVTVPLSRHVGSVPIWLTTNQLTQMEGERSAFQAGFAWGFGRILRLAAWSRWCQCGQSVYTELAEQLVFIWRGFITAYFYFSLLSCIVTACFTRGLFEQLSDTLRFARFYISFPLIWRLNSPLDQSLWQYGTLQEPYSVTQHLLCQSLTCDLTPLWDWDVKPKWPYSVANKPFMRLLSKEIKTNWDTWYFMWQALAFYELLSRSLFIQYKQLNSDLWFLWHSNGASVQDIITSTSNEIITGHLCRET